MTASTARLTANAAAALLTGWLSAQTFVVDVNQGPGTNFISLPAAVASVPDGATLLVRPGSYAGFTLQNKGLTILFDPGTSMSGRVTVADLGPQQAAVIRGMHWNSTLVAPGADYLIHLRDCAGPVHLEEVVAPAPLACTTGPSGCVETQTLHAHTCAQLTLRRCQMSSPTIANSTVAIESCQLLGDSVGPQGSQPPATHPLPGLRLLFSSAVISGTTVIRGAWGWYYSAIAYQNAAAGLEMLASDARILDGTIAAGRVFLANQPLSQHAIRAIGGFVRVDPRTTLSTFNTQTEILGPHQVTPMPVVEATSDASPGLLTVTSDTQPNDLVILVVGLPGSPISLPGFADRFWISNTAFAYQAIGTHGQGTPVTTTLTVPPGFQGLRLGWHAVAFGASTGAQTSNPSTSLIY